MKVLTTADNKTDTTMLTAWPGIRRVTICLDMLNNVFTRLLDGYLDACLNSGFLTTKFFPAWRWYFCQMHERNVTSLKKKWWVWNIIIMVWNKWFWRKWPFWTQNVLDAKFSELLGKFEQILQVWMSYNGSRVEMAANSQHLKIQIKNVYFFFFHWEIFLM